jgi:hypothetical protein
MFHYIYKTTHENGKYYIGRHSTKNKEDGYFGSGTWVRGIKDKSKLKREIIYEVKTVEELLVAEKRFIGEHISNPLCMNFNNNAVGFASGKLNPANSEKETARKKQMVNEKNQMFGKKHSDESKQKMSEYRKGKATWNKGLSGIKTSNKGQTAWNKGVNTGIKSFTGRTHSEESISKMKEGHSNRVKLECPYCKKIIDKPNYTRYHGDRCKFKD